MYLPDKYVLREYAGNPKGKTVRILGTPCNSLTETVFPFSRRIAIYNTLCRIREGTTTVLGIIRYRSRLSFKIVALCFACRIAILYQQVILKYLSSTRSDISRSRFLFLNCAT